MVYEKGNGRKFSEELDMYKDLRADADYIIKYAIQASLPDEAVRQALEGKKFGKGRLYVAAAGKAAWQMAFAAEKILGGRITQGVVCTKYGHVKEQIPGFACYEGGHPVPDENSLKGTEAVLEMVSGLKKEDRVLFLLSGGGSALFEKPLVSLEELEDVTKQLLACGADITEINTIRKRLSQVKGGRFAKICEPAGVYSVILSDVLGDFLDMIASGPVYPDSSTSAAALAIVEKYHLKLSGKVLELLQQETPKALKNVETVVSGSVKNLCRSAAVACRERGYEPCILTDQMDCEAKAAGAFLGAVAKSHQEASKSLAFIAGGETVVCLTGKGMGGRNQELVLAAAEKLAGCRDTALFSIGSDGTDGPTDAAGGYCDGTTREMLHGMGINIHEVLEANDSYHAFEKTGGLIVTGPTGTNVNDVAVVLIHR